MTYAESSKKTSSALIREANAVKRATKAYNGLHRGSASASASAYDIGVAIVKKSKGGAGT